jgi:hypothetical protein
MLSIYNLVLFLGQLPLVHPLGVEHGIDEQLGTLALRLS